MISTSEIKDLNWALKIFRPLLKDLRLQEIKTTYTITFTSNYKDFIKNNMSNCVVIVQTKKFSNEDDRGIFIWQYNKENNMYALYIIINEVLFDNEELETRIRRKATAIHEFTHCVAAMMIFSCLKSKRLIEIVNKRMKKSIHYLNKVDLDAFFEELSKPYHTNDNISIFPDDHFRIEGDGFVGCYEKLNRNFLLSFDLFCEGDFFNKERQNIFKAGIKENNKDKSITVLQEIIPILSEKKALSVQFIFQRIKEEFLPKIMGKN